MTHPDLALPAGYATLLEDLKRDVAATRWRARRVVNTELVEEFTLGAVQAQRDRCGRACGAPTADVELVAVVLA